MAAKRFEVTCESCAWKAREPMFLGQAQSEKRAHEVDNPRHKVAVREVPRLPARPQVADRIRVKEDRIAEMDHACRLAGYDVDLRAVRVVEKTDPFLPGGGQRLYVEGAPHMFSPADVELAWPDPQGNERRKAITEAGWRP